MLLQGILDRLREVAFSTESERSGRLFIVSRCSSLLGWRKSLVGLEAIAIRSEAIASRLGGHR